MNTYWRILSFSRPFSRYLPLYILTALLGVVFGLANFTLIIPLLNVLFENTGEHTQEVVARPGFALTIDYVKGLFNYHFTQVVLERGKVGALQFVCVLLIISVFLANVFRYLSARILASVRAQVVYNVRKDVFSRLTELHLGFFSNERKGDLMSRLTSDVHEVEYSVVNTLTVVFREPVTLIGFFILLFSISVKLTLFTLILLPVSGLIISEISKRLKKQATIGQDTLGHMLGIIDETLSGMRVVKAFNAENFMRSKFGARNRQYEHVVRSMANKRDLASPVSEFMGVGVVTIILLYGGTMVLRNESDLSASEFIGYLVLFSQILVPAKAISSAFGNIQRGLVAGKRLLNLIDTKPAIQDKPGAEVLSSFNNSIEFRNVGFRYEEEAILQDINLRIEKGKTIALVGPSGAGKSTLADLIPRFYDPTEGAILIDGHDLRDCTLHSVRQHMGIVTQESVLFNDTIYNNIAFNHEGATPEQIEHAARIANAHDFIMQTPNGYQTFIGDRGTKLSGGQRQRLSIARAVLKNPPILILDEATSALDTESEKLVQEALINLMRNRTSVVIAHRLSTIQHADEIVVLQAGRIIERGPHEELLARSGLYARLLQMQGMQ